MRSVQQRHNLPGLQIAVKAKIPATNTAYKFDAE